MATTDFFGFQANRLQELRNRQQQRQQEQYRLSLEPHFGAARSGFNNEHDYVQALNEDSEAANLEGLLSGRGPARTAAFYQLPGLRASRPGAGSYGIGGDMSGDMVDDFRAQQHTPVAYANEVGDQQQVFKRGRTLENLSDRDAIVNSLRPTGQRALDLGYTSEFARKTGDIERSEGLNNARAAASAFMDPTVRAAREQEVSEQERLLDARYNRDADNAAKVEAARIAAAGRVGAANASGTNAMSREAIRGLVRSRETQALMGGKSDPARDQQFEDYLFNAANGGGQASPQGIDPYSFNALIAGAGNGTGPGADQLAQFWDRMSPEQQAIVRQRFAGRR